MKIGKYIAVVLLVSWSIGCWAIGKGNGQGKAGSLVEIETTYTYLSNDPNESRALAERHAFERAKRQALENEFSVRVNTTTIVTEQEKQHGENLEASSDLYVNTETVALGVWIRTLEQKVISCHYIDEHWQVTVYVKGEARERKKESIQIQSAFINNAHDKMERTEYYDKDDLFLRFMSPVDGALCVYLVDENHVANCLLPYTNNTSGYQPIETNREYLFFSTETDRNAQEITLGTQEPLIYNTLYIIFSPNTFTKAKDEQGERNWRNEPTPRSLSERDFLDWLSNNQTIDEDMLVKKTTIAIRQNR